MFKFLLSQFIKRRGRNPNNLEMILLRQQASKKAVDKRKIINMDDRQPVDPNKPILGGKNIIETEAQILQRLIKGNKDSIGRLKNKPLDPDDVLPNYNETPGEFARRETPGSKENLLQELKIAYRKEFDRLKGDETAKELKEILKNLDTDGVPFAAGGRAGLYQGGQAQIEPDLSDIGHGSDALMARNTLLTPGSQATTSTGLNYLLGEDNDTTRVPYKEKGSVSLLDFINVNASGTKSGKNQIQGVPKGITVDSSTINAIIDLDIPINEKINLLGSYAYGKNRNKIEKGDKELFLDEDGYKDRSIGFGVNQGNEGLSGSVVRNLETGDNDYQLKFLKNFADGGRIPYGHGDMVLPKPKPMDEYMLKQVLSQAGANTLDPKTREMFIQMYKKKIREKNSKADGGRTEFQGGGFLQLTPENISQARNMPWGQALKTEIPGSSTYKGFNPNYKGTGATGLGGYIKSGLQSITGNVPTTGGVGGATPLTRKIALGAMDYAPKVLGFASKAVGPLSFLFDAAPANADEIDMTAEDFMKMKHIDKKKQEKIKQETATFKQIRDTEAAEAAAQKAEERASYMAQAQRNADRRDPGQGNTVTGFGKSGLGRDPDDKMAQGGPARQNFGMGKRAFLKWLGSGVAGIAGLKSGILGVGKKSAVKSVIAPATQAANEAAPAYFLKLVAKIKKLGDDVTETASLAERQSVKRYKDFEMTTDNTTGEIQIFKKSQSDEAIDRFGGENATEEVFMRYKPSEDIIGKNKKPVKTGPEYEENTSYISNNRENTGGILDNVDGVPDEVLKEVGEAVVKKADGGRIGYKLGKKVVETVIKKAGEGKFTKNEVLLNMFKNTIKETKDVNTKTKFINFIEEIKLKPELSKDPNVWNFFTKGLPKNQKLVVYGDDTVDFWTQSEFGPHNIATSAKFQKKHPYLTKDQAVKIQNMEPEDQIFEMKRLDAIRKRTANATGGRVPMVFGGGIYKAIIKNLAKARGVNPSEYLKITNYKALPSDVKKYLTKTDFEKMKAGRIEMFENWVDMAKSRKEFLRNIEEGKKSPAAPIFENLEQSFKSPVPSSVTDKDILQGEFILKNLKTKNRKLHSSGGIAAMLGE